MKLKELRVYPTNWNELIIGNEKNIKQKKNV